MLTQKLAHLALSPLLAIALRCMVAVSLLAVVSATRTCLAAAVYDYATGERVTRMWVPDGLSIVKGILIWGNTAHGDSRAFVDNKAFQGFAQLYEFVIIATGFWGNLSGDEILTWEEHLQAFADMSGHPEIVNAPWAPLGFSNGGQMSYGFNALRPEKVIGFAANKGGYYNDPLPPEASLATPGLLIAGEADAEFRRTAIHALFTDNRPRGALWAWVEQQSAGHQDDDIPYLLPFMAECLRLRYPLDQSPSADSPVALNALHETDGWLLDQNTWNQPLTVIAPYDAYIGDPMTAGWAPSEAAAYWYRAFATRTDWLKFGNEGRVSDRPLYIEIPTVDAFSTQAPGIPPLLQQIVIHTDEYPQWTRTALFSGADLLSELFNDGSPKSYALDTVTLPAGIHGLSALITDLDGTIRTTDLRVRVVAEQNLGPEVPSMSSAGLLLLAGSLTFLMSRRRVKLSNDPQP